MRAKEARQRARGQNSAEVAAYPLSSGSHFPFSFCLIKVNHLQSSTDWEEALLFFSPHRGGNPKTTVSQEGWRVSVSWFTGLPAAHFGSQGQGVRDQVAPWEAV